MNGKGFTLIEMLTVLSIVAVLGVCSIPAVFSWKARVTLQGDARMFAADLQKVKMQAIKLNCPVVIEFSENGYRIFEDSGEGGGKRGDWKQTGTETTLGEKSFSKGTVFRHNFSGKRLRFSGTGGNKVGTAVFEGNNGKQVQVVLSVLGRVRINYV